MSFSLVENLYIGAERCRFANAMAIKTISTYNTSELDNLLFERSSLASWGILEVTGGFREAISIRRIARCDGADEVVKLLQDASRRFCSPPYSEYLKTIDQFAAQQKGHVLQVLTRIIEEKYTGILSKHDFLQFEENYFGSFPHQMSVIGDVFMGDRISLGDAKDIIDKKNDRLRFIGKYFFIPADCSLDDLLLAMINERAIGNVERGGSYSLFRSQGAIYSAFSRLFLSAGVFVTGVITKGVGLNLKDVDSAIEGISISETRFMQIRKKVLAGILGLCGQGGQMYGLLQHSFECGRIITLSETVERLESITYSCYMQSSRFTYASIDISLGE